MYIERRINYGSIIVIQLVGFVNYLIKCELEEATQPPPSRTRLYYFVYWAALLVCVYQIKGFIKADHYFGILSNGRFF
jgi:hypothetical protein